ncbi:MAG: outer membrane beta-barrel protein [Planctomycetota bacterium]|nr:outer membrane beta-barrel protein [Planctomycetota bacterium]
MRPFVPLVLLVTLLCVACAQPASRERFPRLAEPAAPPAPETVAGVRELVAPAIRVVNATQPFLPGPYAPSWPFVPAPIPFERRAEPPDPVALIELGQLPALQEDFDRFRAGLYVGIGGGVADVDTEGIDVDGELAGLGHPDLDTTLDDTDIGWKVFAGYRFEQPFAVEVGYTDLGTVESVITGAVADFDQFLKDVSDIHPFLGEGVTLSAVWYPIQTDSMVALIRVGGWYWEADVDIRAASGERIEIDEDGIDLLFGVGAIWNVAEDLSFRAEYERYIIDHENADFFTLGIQYDLNWRL